MEKIVKISGMTCNHCVKSVSEELNELPGVTEIKIDLIANGISTATIQSNEELSDDDITEAITEAGYSVVKNK